LAIRLWVEGCAEAQGYTGELEELLPEGAGVYRITVTDDGAGETMKPHDVVEEGLSDRHGGVGVAEGDEVGVLGESINDDQHHRLATHTWKSLNEVHGNI
jgi:hypothetical protein